MLKNLLFILLFAGALLAQESIFKGTILDAKTGTPISGAVIFVNGNFYYTDNAGHFNLKLRPGNYNLKISRIGYKMHADNINAVEGEELYREYRLTEALIQLNEVVVGSRKTESVLRYSPYSESLVSGSEIEAKSFQTLSDLLQTKPGLSLQRDGIWGTEVSLRGFNRQNIVTLIDGNRIETSTDIAARLSMFDLNDVERIEVIKGAASSIYGSGAVGGIINIVSKEPAFNERFFLNGDFSTVYNSVNDMSGFAASLFSGNQFYSSKFSGSFRKAGNVETPVGKIKNSQFKDYNFSGVVNFSFITDHFLKLNYQTFKAEDAGIPGADPLFPNQADVRYPEVKRELLSAGYEVRNLSELVNKVSLKYSYQFVKRRVENIPHQVQNIPASGTQPPRRVSVLKILPGADHITNSLQLQTNLNFAANNIFIAGIDYWKRKYEGERLRYQQVEVFNQTGTQVVKTSNVITSEKPLPNSSFESIGLYAQDDLELIAGKLNLSFGARIDKINVRGESTLNPQYQITDGVRNDSPAGQKLIWRETANDDLSYSANFGAVYFLTSNVDLSLSLGYSFRSPSLEERFQYIDLGNLVRLGNPDLDPEKGYSADIGVRAYYSNLKLIASLFYNYLKDLVVEEPATFENRPARRKANVGEARLYGFDMSAEYNFYNDLIFYSVASFVKGDDINNQSDLPEIPPLNGAVGLKFPVSGLATADFSALLFAAQNKVAAGELKTPGYAVFNFALVSNRFSTGLANFKIALGVENILDKNYRNHLSTTRGSVTVEPGRNFYIKLIVNW